MFCPFLENREEEKMINKLVAKIKETKAPIVVGLDPMLNYTGRGGRSNLAV